MTDAYDLYQQGREHLQRGMAAQATVALEKAKQLEPDKASIREALGIAYFRIQRWARRKRSSAPCSSSRPPTTTRTTRSGATLEKQGRDAEANGHYKLASSMSPSSEQYADRIMDLEPSEPDEPSSA